jgi:hypothetical protein
MGSISAGAYRQTDQSSDLRNTQYYWFLRLINGDLFRLLSQRRASDLEHWANQRRWSVKENWHRSSTQRYSAVNLQQRTAEVRIFRGNMREERIRKAVESVIAAVEFSRERAARLNNESLREVWRSNLDKSFIRWAMEREGIYRNLAAYLREIGAVRSSDVQPGQTVSAANAVEMAVVA